MISVETPTIVPSSTIYIIFGDAATLTCKTEPDDFGGATYQWKLNNRKVYVICIFVQSDLYYPRYLFGVDFRAKNRG